MVGRILIVRGWSDCLFKRSHTTTYDMDHMQEKDSTEIPPHVKHETRTGAPSFRRWVQLGFAFGAILTGVQFHRFVASLTDGARAYAARPAEVDAWLPISSLMSLFYFVKTGIANTVHPAGLVLFTLILVLAVFSLLYKNFWCRYLCPYGALLGLASSASPLAVQRDSAACTLCLRCTQACPNRIAVHAQESVRSPECTACYGCVTACQQPGALRTPHARACRERELSARGLIVTLPQNLGAYCGFFSQSQLTKHNRLRK